MSSSRGGDGHTLALATSGEVFSWGDGDHGKLGHGSNERARRPRVIASMRPPPEAAAPVQGGGGPQGGAAAAAASASGAAAAAGASSSPSVSARHFSMPSSLAR